MSGNPVARVRFRGSAVFVATVAAVLMAAPVAGRGEAGWPRVIAAFALGCAAASFIVHLHHPDRVDAARNERNLAAHCASLAFGYWADLLVFTGLLGTVWIADPAPHAAFFWIGPVLGIALAAQFLTSVLRGRGT